MTYHKIWFENFDLAEEFTVQRVALISLRLIRFFFLTTACLSYHLASFQLGPAKYTVVCTSY